MVPDGWVMVEGRSRGHGRREAHRWEPIILGKADLSKNDKYPNKGGRPPSDRALMLVMELASYWLLVTGSLKSGRSDKTGFAALVHCAFQWLWPDNNDGQAAARGAATYALRRYWEEIRDLRLRTPSADDSPDVAGLMR
jgi:hypothetical protein